MSEYTDSMWSSRQESLRIMSDTDRKIADIYDQAYQDLADRAGKQKNGSLSERWQLDMSRSLEERMRQLNGDVTTTVLASVEQAGSLPGKANADWLDLVLAKCGKTGSGDAFRSVLTRTSDEALLQVINGAAYLDSQSLSRRIWNNTTRARDGINAAIQQGIAQKKSAYELAKDLEQFVNPSAWEDYDWRKVYPDIPSWVRVTNVEKHAQTLARTSINHAYHLAVVETGEKNPFATRIHWELSPQHYERQILPQGADVCDEYADHDEGLGRGNWPFDRVPLPHPKCLCYQYAVVPQNMNQCADELRRWMDGEPNATLDEAFANWKNELGVGAGVTPQKSNASTGRRPQDERTRLMGEIAQQPWTETMKRADREAVFDMLGHATQRELEFFAKHGTMIKGNFYDKNGGYYSFGEKSVFLDIGAPDKRSAAIGYPTSDVRAFLHEIGHLFDYQAFPGSSLHQELGQAFEDQLAKDLLEHSNKVLINAGETALQSLSHMTDQQKHVLSHDLWQKAALKNAVSDLAGGITGKRVEGWYGHKAAYWQENAPGVEAIGHMYEAMMAKGEKLQIMEEYFTDAYQMYLAAFFKP